MLKTYWRDSNLDYRDGSTTGVNHIGRGTSCSNAAFHCSIYISWRFVYHSLAYNFRIPNNISLIVPDTIDGDYAL